MGTMSVSSHALDADFCRVAIALHRVDGGIHGALVVAGVVDWSPVRRGYLDDAFHLKTLPLSRDCGADFTVGACLPHFVGPVLGQKLAQLFCGRACHQLCISVACIVVVVQGFNQHFFDRVRHLAGACQRVRGAFPLPIGWISKRGLCAGLFFDLFF